MFINKNEDGSNNICGKKIAILRKDLKISQRILADRLQLSGLDVDKNAIQRIECGKRFVTDIELVAFSKIFNITVDELLKKQNTTFPEISLYIFIHHTIPPFGIIYPERRFLICVYSETVQTTVTTQTGGYGY